MGGQFDAPGAGLIILGAFYAFAGIAAARMAVMSNFLDLALSKISMKPIPRIERQRFWWLVGSAAVVFIGGIALLLRSMPALWLFCLSSAGQALYLFVLGPQYFDREDPPDSTGRSQTSNAFYIYLVATALVALAASAGRLRQPADLTAVEIGAGFAAVGGYALLVARWLWPRRDKEDDA